MKYWKEVDDFGSEIQKAWVLEVGPLTFSVHTNASVHFAFICKWDK